MDTQGAWARYTILESGSELFIQIRLAERVQAYRLTTAEGGPVADRSAEALIAVAEQVARDVAQQMTGRDG